MAKCDLRIVFATPGPHHAGEILRGEVTAEVYETVSFNKLTLHREWRTHGRGNKTTGGATSVVLAPAGEWSPGAYRFPFEFQVPNGPFTYRGNLLNVDWYARAELDVPWAFDPKNEVEIPVLPGPSPELADRGPEFAACYATVRPRSSGTGGMIAGLAFGTAFAGVGVVLTVFGASSLALGKFGGFGPGSVGLLFVVAGIGGGYMAVRNRLAQRRIGRPEVTVGPRDVAPGGALDVRIQLQPASVVELASVKVKLLGQEVVVSGSGTDKTTHRHTLHETELVLASDRTLSPSELPHFDTRFVLPASAAWTFKASSNEVKWEVTVYLDIRGWPDWSDEYPIVVRPA